MEKPQPRIIYQDEDRAQRNSVERPGLLIDRDGVINAEIGYLYRPEDCIFVDGVFELTKAFAALGFPIIICTNQAGIARGYYTEAMFQNLMDWMRGEFRAHGVPIAAVYYCPDHPTAGNGPYRRENSWRKPGPGMFLQAALDFGLDLTGSWCIGDNDTDVAAGRAAGVGRLVRFTPKTTAPTYEGGVWIVPNLLDVVALLKSSLDAAAVRT